MYELRGFMKDWKLTIEQLDRSAILDGQHVHQPWMVRVRIDVPDTYTHKLVCIEHNFAFACKPSIEEVHDTLRRIAVHEIDEGFWANGEVYRNPHLNPEQHNPRPWWMSDYLPRWERLAL